MPDRHGSGILHVRVVQTFSSSPRLCVTLPVDGIMTRFFLSARRQPDVQELVPVHPTAIYPPQEILI